MAETVWRKANDRLAGIGPQALLRRHGRNEKSAALEDIERFGGDVVRAADTVARCEHSHDQLTDEVAQGVAWHLQHDWRRGRLNEIETELADLGHIDLRHIPLAERSPGLGRDRSRTAGRGLRPDRVPLARADASDVPAWWADRLAEIAAPPLPGKDAGLGIDLGL